MNNKLFDIEPIELPGGWIPYKKDTPPPLGIEVLAQSTNWIDEDYNPDGIRVGFQNCTNDLEDSGYQFLSAKWCNYHDEYHTDEESKPEKWKPIER